MLKGKKWIAFLTMFLFVAALTFLSRENGSAKRQEVWSNTMVDSGYEDEAPYKGKIALTFDDGPSPVCTPQLLDGLATGKKISESAVSPATVDQMARAEKCRPPLATFMRLMT